MAGHELGRCSRLPRAAWSANTHPQLQKDADLRISEDAGRYMCEFIYYSSLAHRLKQQKPRKVVFLHVPSDASAKSVAQGRELMINLIRAIVESEVASRIEKQGGDGAELKS